MRTSGRLILVHITSFIAVPRLIWFADRQTVTQSRYANNPNTQNTAVNLCVTQATCLCINSAAVGKELSFAVCTCYLYPDLLADSLADLLAESSQQMCSLSCSICASHSTIINQCVMPIMVLRRVSLNIAFSIYLTGNACKLFPHILLPAVFWTGMILQSWCRVLIMYNICS